MGMIGKAAQAVRVHLEGEESIQLFSVHPPFRAVVVVVVQHEDMDLPIASSVLAADDDV